MLYDKPATSVEDQIANLQVRGLVVNDVPQAIRHMRAIGYYRLSAYWYFFEDEPEAGQTRSKKFSADTTWEQVIRLYAFDRRLRGLVMEAIERFEVAVRSAWTNRLTLARGSHAYLDPGQFNNPYEHASMVAQVARSVSKSSETFVKHYEKKYTSPYIPPLWAVCETMTIGQLSVWVASTKDNAVRSMVAKDMNLPTKEVLENVLQIMSLTRNICAHHGRFWNRRLVKRLMLIKRLTAEFAVIEPVRGQLQPDNRPYNVLVVLIYILRQQGDVSDWHQGLVSLLETATDGQRREMGFPDDWRDRASWKAPA